MEMQSHAFAPAVATMPVASRERFVARDVVLRHLKRSDEIAGVLHLREEIDLSVHAAAGPHFATLEKKETKSASSSALT